jgi:DNA-binding NarL/FixJ family response regulator
MSEGLRVLIADDHPIVRRGLREILGAETRIAEVIEAAHPQQVLDLAARPAAMSWCWISVCRARRPRSPQGSAPRSPQAARPHPEHATRGAVRRARAAGRRRRIPHQRFRARQDCSRRSTRPRPAARYVSAAVAEQLAAGLTSDVTKPPQELLSDREYQVLRLIASGKTVGDIAEQLSLSVKTISSYRARILEKMGMSNNAELMLYAITNKLVD